MPNSDARAEGLGEGEVFAGYTIIRRLGSGGMGQVYLAQHPRLPRRDAGARFGQRGPGLRHRLWQRAHLPSGRLRAEALQQQIGRRGARLRTNQPRIWCFINS